MTQDELKTPCTVTWCPGCGNFSIWAAFKNAAVKNGWNKENTVITAGIGCHGHILNYINLPFFEGLHGRAIPLAEGIKIVRPKSNVFVFTGDGDCLAEGGNHFIHACRRNNNITILLHDNAIYGLTTGQTSPVSPKGLKTKSTPAGNLDEPFSPLTLAIASGATFAARSYVGDINQLTEIMEKANAHQGLAVIDILQPCVTFNKICTHQFFQQNVYTLDANYDPKDKMQALEKSMEWGDKKIPLGVIYEVSKPTPESQTEVVKNGTLEELLKRYI